MSDEQQLAKQRCSPWECVGKKFQEKLSASRRFRKCRSPAVQKKGIRKDKLV
jgi:hypothetical protein